MGDGDEGGGLRAAALAYAHRGVRVLPCEPFGKRPLIADGFKGARSDERVVEDWWERWPHANIGLAIPERMLVVDVDPRNGGATPAGLPETRAASTPSGGDHFYYKVPADLATKPQLAPGVDLKAGGKGYVLLPPSATEAGAYAWHGTGREPVADLPPEWIERLTKPKPQPRPPVEATTLHPMERGTPRALMTRAYAICDLAVAEPGTRNQTLNRVAFKLGQVIGTGELREDETLHELLLVAERIGLEPDEAVGVIRRGFEAGLQHPR